MIDSVKYDSITFAVHGRGIWSCLIQNNKGTRASGDSSLLNRNVHVITGCHYLQTTTHLPECDVISPHHILRVSNPYHPKNPLVFAQQLPYPNRRVRVHTQAPTMAPQYPTFIVRSRRTLRFQTRLLMALLANGLGRPRNLQRTLRTRVGSATGYTTLSTCQDATSANHI